MQQPQPIPTTLGRYEVVRHLATGGMAELLLARTMTPHGVRHVVVKRIPPQQLGDPTFVQMFLDEARIATLLQHPNIVRVLETAEDHGEYFFAMEYVHGEDLRRVLREVHRRRDQVPIALVTSIIAGAAAGLHHAHKLLGPDHRPLGIVHRDVSPANILVGYDGVVRVADFGIAKAALRTIETRSGTLKGKVSYMSPEQVTGKFVDRRSDVYALGIVLYELATARRLFKGENDFLTMSSIVQGEIPPPSQYRRDLPKALETIITTALALSPTERFQSAEELRAALVDFTESLGMKMTSTGIADYMKHLFGQRPEPWLVDEAPTLITEVDFDGAGTGLARVPETFALPQTMRAAASAPILYARASVTNEPLAPHEIDASPPRAWTENPTGSGSNDSFAWMRDATPIRSTRSRHWIPIVAGVAVAAIAAAIIVAKTSSPANDEAERVKIAATTTPEVAAPSPPPVVDEAAKVDPEEAARIEAAAKIEAAKADAEAARAAKLEAERQAKADAEAARLAKLEAAKADAEAARAAKLEAERQAKADAEAARAAKLEADRQAKAEANAARAAKLEADRQARTEANAARAAKLKADRQAKAEVSAKAAAAHAARAEAAAAKAEADRQAKAEAAAKTAAKRPKKPVDKKTEKNWDPDSMFAPK